jgi:glycosyltransferase involved in cell wall biosynthesis
MPALNEEENIGSAIEDTIFCFEEFGIEGEVLVINDGSSDSTPQVVEDKMKEFPEKVRVLNHSLPQGIGASFWEGVDNARGDIVCMLPGDNENDPGEILRYTSLLDNVDIVIPFVFNKEVRSKWRNFLSFHYHRFINCTFSTSLNYTTGTVLYRKSLLEELDKRRRGYFFQTDILIRLVKRGYLFAEVPYKLRDRKGGKSKAMRISSLNDIIKGYLCLVKDIYFKKEKKTYTYTQDSASAKRRKSNIEN